MTELEDKYLAHHGVLGMKWGIRRYQNKDGSYTSAGKKRVNEAKKVIKKKTSEVSSKAKEAWNDPVKRQKMVNAGKMAASAAILAIGTYAITKNELRMVPKTITTYDHLMPIYGAGGKMLFPPRSIPKATQVMIPNYVTKGHKAFGSVMNKAGKGFDMSKFTIDQLKQLDLY